MSSAKLHHLQMLIDELDLTDKTQLLQHLAPQVAAATSIASGNSMDANSAWRKYRELGERLAARSIAGAASLTQAVSDMRR